VMLRVGTSRAAQAYNPTGISYVSGLILRGRDLIMVGEPTGRDVNWTHADPDYLPPEIDVTKPSMARVYDARLGGKDNFAADRAVAEEVNKVFPDGGK